MSRVLKSMAVITLVVTTASANIAICKGCHGENFEKKAMGKSKVVKNMTKAEIKKALKGYKNGNYGGVMKKVMKGQVEKLSDSDIDKLAAKIKK